MMRTGCLMGLFLSVFAILRAPFIWGANLARSKRGFEGRPKITG
jgi:hypothetical protein